MRCESVCLFVEIKATDDGEKREHTLVSGLYNEHILIRSTGVHYRRLRLSLKASQADKGTDGTPFLFLFALCVFFLRHRAAYSCA
jgi:hypothetical protein